MRRMYRTAFGANEVLRQSLEFTVHAPLGKHETRKAVSNGGCGHSFRCLTQTPGREAVTLIFADKTVKRRTDAPRNTTIPVRVVHQNRKQVRAHIENEKVENGKNYRLRPAPLVRYVCLLASSYRDIVVVGIIGALVALTAVIALGSLVGSF